jgi:small subunit ribosomal protein S14
MARKSNVARDKKRAKMIKKLAQKRSELKAKGDLEALHKLPRNSSSVRRKNRCLLTGGPRAYMRRFKMSRIAFRELASRGEIMGVKKSSW